MNRKLLGCLVAGTLTAALAMSTPALARGGFGGGGHFGGGGMHFGGGGMHFGGGGMRFGGGGMRFGGGPGMRFGGFGMGRTVFAPGAGRFARASFVNRPVFGPRFNRFAFRHHRFHRFAFFGAPFVYSYAAYDGCWRRVWTPYGWRWADVCSGYGY